MVFSSVAILLSKFPSFRQGKGLHFFCSQKDSLNLRSFKKNSMYKNTKTVSADEAVKVLKSGDHVHLSSVASVPQILVEAMCRRGDAGELRDVHIHHLHTEGAAPYAEPRYEGIFQHDAFFVGGNVRKNVQAGYADYIPVFLSETQRLYREGYLKCNVAMIQVCPPDEHGYVSLGTSVDATLAAVETADYVLAVINKNVPRALGDALIPMHLIDYAIIDDKPLEPAHFSEPNEQEIAIGKHCAELIEDGACMQMGIGAIPNAVLAQLGNHKNLGIHTEMFADGVLPLVEKGVINGANKAIDKGKMVSTFLMGSQKVYDFIHNNPQVAMMDVRYTNDPFVIAQNPKVTAINSAIQIDLTGQVCADSIGTKFFSGAGGQIDFVYGASRSKGGKAIIAMPSITNKGVSKIAATLNLGAGVVTSRYHIHWFVSEFGAVNLYGKTLQERARLLISVAHPDAREELDRAAFERFGPHFHYIASK
jgi:acyl-CoA hydrolase